MGSLSNESFEEFLASLKEAGVIITNERELRERLSEVARWQYAFTTLAENGRSIGIRFQDQSEGRNQDKIRHAFARFQFPDRSVAIFDASLKSSS